MLMFKQVTMLIGGLAVTGVLTLATTARAGDLAFDLGPFLAESGLKPADIRHVLTLPAPTAAAWLTGFNGKLKNGSLQLKPLSTSGRAERALLMNYGGDATGVALSACDADGTCQPVAVEKTGTRHAFELDGQRWELSVLANPCDTGGACRLTVPSWALEKRRTLGDGAMQPFPGMATIVDHTDGLSVFDTVTGSEWVRWRRQGFDALGTLRGARFASATTLALDFAKGTLLIDFVADAAFRIDGHGVARGALGVGVLGEMDFKSLSANASADLGAPLLVMPELVVWPDMILHGALNKAASAPTPCRFMLAESSTGAALCAHAAGWSTWRWDAALARFDRTDEGVAAGVPAATLRLLGGRVYRLGIHGLYALGEGVERPTSLSFAATSMTFAGEGDMFARLDSESGDCRVVHFRQHATMPESFKESGLQAPCGVLTGFVASGQSVSISVFDGRKINVYWD